VQRLSKIGSRSLQFKPSATMTRSFLSCVRHQPRRVAQYANQTGNVVVVRPFSRMPFDRWPAQDRRLWSLGVASGDLLDRSGPGSRWRPATRSIVQRSYGFALAWLEETASLDGTLAPCARWTQDCLRAYIRDLAAQVRPATVRHRIVNLERALAVVAPHADRSMFRVAVRHLTQPTDRSRKRSRLQEPANLVDLGFQLMQQAEAGVHASARKNAVMFRTGLQVALLAMRPLRMRNFTSIRIGFHLVRDGDTWWLRFGREETKTRQLIEVPFPTELCPALERYLFHYRDLLAAGSYHGDRLWLGYRFTPQSQHTLQLAVARITQQAFGKPINPHLFRDCAATSIAILDPSAVRIGAAVLGHGNFASTEKHYNLACSLQAGRAYGDLIRARRAGGQSARGHDTEPRQPKGAKL
jgi:integrase/recombinase XerD